MSVDESKIGSVHPLVIPSKFKLFMMYLAHYIYKYVFFFTPANCYHRKVTRKAMKSIRDARKLRDYRLEHRNDRRW